jgi:indolepyruvate ferredoxin oxidoreductase beta subunit
MTTNILITGVGGQGIITASKVLAEVALLAGWQIKKSEVHGMSQRGGSVESHVRFCADSPVYSPLIPAGEADLLVAFEALEALRGVPMTRPDGVLLVDDRKIAPMSVTVGPHSYPEDPVGLLRQSGRRVVIVPSFELARSLGEPRAANMVMLGAASRLLSFDTEQWREAIALAVKPKALEINLKAFDTGFAAFESR